MVVQILRICLILYDKRRCYVDSRFLIKEIRKDFCNHSPFSILHFSVPPPPRATLNPTGYCIFIPDALKYEGIEVRRR